ncbi:MAG TPA: IS110 family transposase [Candidatus Sulfotelmatobacter sp.]|nr:IS110 family transposase [Candidatus Sulfotelmatobacter sp.]
MKKDSTGKKDQKQAKKAAGQAAKTGGKGRQQITVGMDLGDKSSRYCAIEQEGEALYERSVQTTKKGMGQVFGAMGGCRIALEVGTHSPWVSRLLSGLGHEVIVANARQVKLISQSTRKDDKLDARTLARLARIDPELLRPIRHRSEQAQLDLTQIRVRAGLVEARTGLVNAARGLAKALGERLPKCSTDSLDVEQLASLPAPLSSVLQPLLEEVAGLTEKIQACDKRIEQIARTEYPETKLLEQISGVGTLIALTFVLTVEDAGRFQKSRDVGCYVGLRPKRSESGESQPQLGISKEGDLYLRKLLVQGAHCILSRRGPDTDLKRWGGKLAARGGKNAKKRALVAVARKLAILLHRLWVTGQVYEPLRHSQAHAAAKQKAA